ncbi:MAG TPA: TatD family hydrolase [Methanomassiliicoccales archaeon]|nr:TatD family hydrolase [Methanomassiliicoccales archaeon]
MTSLPILDNHVHLDPKGRNIDAAKDFEKAGGTHLILVHLPYDDVPIADVADFEDSYAITLKMADRVRNETKLGCDVVLGPHPVLIMEMLRNMSLAEAIEVMKDGMEAAQRLVLEKKAVAIGEIGRPHFPVDPEVLEASNTIMAYGMSLAKEAGCPVVLHTESATPEMMAGLAKMADEAGLERGRVIKHYCPPLVREEENSGLFPSVLSSRTAIHQALDKGSRFTMETDYLDDMHRPGAVMAITTVPKRTKAMLDANVMSPEQAFKIHKENPEKLYGIEVKG